MKKIFYITSVILSSYSFAQVAIGNGAMPSNDYVSLELGTAAPAENKGLILPWVTSEAAVNTSVVGTLIFDSATQKVKLATSATPTTATTANTIQTRWLDLTGTAATPTTRFVNPRTTNGEAATAKVIIGTNSSAANGILVLETPNPDTAPKAMVLPRVNNYSDIVNPSAGMIVYLKSSKKLAVFNGREWSF